MLLCSSVFNVKCHLHRRPSRSHSVDLLVQNYRGSSSVRITMLKRMIHMLSTSCSVGEAFIIPSGGESLFVDGVAAANKLKELYPAYYDLLVKTKVRFTDAGNTAMLWDEKPVIQEEGLHKIVFFGHAASVGRQLASKMFRVAALRGDMVGPPELGSTRGSR